MGKYVCEAYPDSEGPDNPVHYTVWLQHSLSAYCILDTGGYIYIYCITQTVIRLCGFIIDLDLYCSYEDNFSYGAARTVFCPKYLER